MGTAVAQGSVGNSMCIIQQHSGQQQSAAARLQDHVERRILGQTRHQHQHSLQAPAASAVSPRLSNNSKPAKWPSPSLKPGQASNCRAALLESKCALMGACQGGAPAGGPRVCGRRCRRS